MVVAGLRTGNECAIAIMRALGIDATNAYRMELTFHVNEVPRVVVYHHAGPEIGGDTFLAAVEAGGFEIARSHEEKSPS